VYHFEIPASQGGGQPVSQQQATLAALHWAKGFYNATSLTVDSIQYQNAPNPHYLVHLTGDVGGSRQPLYAAVLPDGKIVRPVAGPGQSERPATKPMKKGGSKTYRHGT